ncbi:nucleotide sugar dehydrogenase [Afifella pfennigii]|uniref:nucleotide sugar dehydrogenase n=1 Tax=Afifella pfennigii TaxID=209897 RepID=UPI0009FDC5F4|nr:nucleotide sugar dehydrogenase [Afifella pfennigii]
METNVEIPRLKAEHAYRRLAAEPLPQRRGPAPLPSLENLRIGVIGLGYVGLPVAVAFGRAFPVIGYDINRRRIEELSKGHDATREVTAADLAEAERLTFCDNEAALRACNFYIVSVPTPIDQAKRPDTTALERASAAVGRVLSEGDVVVYESTVYPGATEEVCVPILERESGKTFNEGFFVGYSPERINPGDREHRLETIVKVTSGSTPDAADLVDRAYASIISAGTHKVSSIRAAEAAKVIENIQRDVNIALVNELAMLFKILQLDTMEVLQAAGTKWNFHPYAPGLVGGHCIGVDPYYLTYKAQSVGFHTDVILAGRRVNDNMAVFVASDLLRAMLAKKIDVGRARVLVAGFTFKENCPDLRNTQVAVLAREIATFCGEVAIHDPFADSEEAEREYGLSVHRELPEGPFDCIVFAVKHDELKSLLEHPSADLLAEGGFIYDLKGALGPAEGVLRL